MRERIVSRLRMPAAVFGIVLFAATVFGQATGGQVTGAITGQVIDRRAGAVAGAKVVLRNEATQAERVTTTDGAGRYEFSGVAIGIYRVRVESEGFSAGGRSLTLAEAGERVTANFDLAAGGLSEQVTVTAARGERDALELAMRTEAVADDKLFEKTLTSTYDALAQSPNITPVGNGPFQLRPRLRGLDSTRILIMVDGERLNTSRVATDRSGPEIGLIDPSSIQSVEVISGSGSVLYGTDALAGTINIITDQPVASGGGWRVGGGLNLFYSSNEDGRRGTARFDLSNQKFAFRFAGELERFANYFAGEPFNESSVYLHDQGLLRQQVLSRVFRDPFNAPFTRTSAEVPNSQSHGSNINSVARFFPNERDSFRLSWTRRRNADIGFPDFSPPYFSQIITLPYSNLDKYGVRYERRNLTPWFTGLSANAYFQVQDRDLRNNLAVYSSAPPSPGQQPLDSIIEIKLLTDTRQNVKTYGWDVQTNFLIRGRNILTAGASYFLDHSRDSRETLTSTGIVGFATRAPAPPRFIPANISFGPPSRSFPQRVPKSNFQNLGVFVQDEYDINRWLRVTGGLRVDRFDISTSPTPGYNPFLPGIENAQPPIDLSKFPSQTGQEINRTTVTGDIGVIVRPTSDLSLTARVGRSFRHPNLEELFFSGPATIGNLIPNTQVKPETGINVDVGARLRTSRYAASFTYFNNNYRNFISGEIVSQSPTIGLILQAVNFARLRLQGFEADGEIPFSWRSTVLTPFVTVGYLRGDIIEAINPFTGTALRDAPADNISPLKAVAGLRWASANTKWWSEYNVRAQANVKRVSPLLTDSPFLIAQDFFGLRGFGIQTLRAGYNFNRERGRVAVTAAIENLTNEFYREQFQFAPSRGRSFTIGLLLKYF